MVHTLVHFLLLRALIFRCVKYVSRSRFRRSIDFLLLSNDYKLLNNLLALKRKTFRHAFVNLEYDY